MNFYLPDKNSPLYFYKKFYDVEYIVSDIDGTLTFGKIPITQKIREKTENLRSKDVVTTIATGRPFRGAHGVIQSLGIVEGTPLLFYNGAVLLEYCADGVVELHNIPFDEIMRILNIVSTCRAGVYIYTCDINTKNIFDTCRNGLREQVYYIGEKVRYTDVNGNYVLPLTKDVLKQGQVVSILIEKTEISEEIFYQVTKFLKQNSKVSYTDSGNGFIEICSVHNKKSIIIDELRRRKNKNKIGKILAIGDNDNDIDLFKAADISVAVANSSDKAKKNADYLCRKSDAGGYLEMLTVIEMAKTLRGRLI